MIVHEISSSLTRDFYSFADKSSAPALVRFSRPHTVFGTMVSWNNKIKEGHFKCIMIGQCCICIINGSFNSECDLFRYIWKGIFLEN